MSHEYMSLHRQNKLFAVIVAAALVALLTYLLLSQYWLWYYGDKHASSDWPNYWRKARAEVGSFGARVVRPIKVSSRLPSCLAELNRFIAVAKPDGLKQAIKTEDVVTARVDRAGVWFMLETKTHYVEFFTNRLAAPQILSFNPKQHDARLPESYEATGKWGKEEALAETLRIMKELGMQFTVGRHEVHTKEFPLKKTQARVTPFYQVRLYSTNGISSINAEFRVAEAAPGRLTTWWVDNSARALQRARVMAAVRNMHNLHSITNKSLITTPVSRRAFEEMNRFVSRVQPFGTDGLIKEEEITYVNMDSGVRLLLETKSHLAEFFIKGRATPKLRNFLATQDMSNPVAKPEAKKELEKTSYKATAKWTEQEAVAETHRILEKLGIRFEIGESKARPFIAEVRTPTGEHVTVTPFWTVDLLDTAGIRRITAEFRMGESGPGRLTEWFDNTRPEADPRTAPANPNPQ